MKLQPFTDRDQLAAYFQQDLPLFAYCLGDLDDHYLADNNYYGIQGEEGVSHVIQIYHGEGITVLLVLDPDGSFNQELIDQLDPILPNEIYAHLSPGIERFFRKSFTLQDYGPHFKMALLEPDRMIDVSTAGTSRLGESDLADVLELYRESYPDHSFEPRSLSSGKYIGWREGGKLVSIAGVHVYSSRFQIAAVGNITTHPDFRGQGFARKVTARLCRDLGQEVGFIGLNVKCSNQAAVRLYESLGFKICSKYGEYSLKKGNFS